MKPLKATLFLFFLLIGVSSHSQEKYSQVKIYVPAQDVAARKEIIGLLEIDHFYDESGAIISEVSSSDLQRLKASRTRYKYEVLVDDVAKDLEEKNKRYYAERRAGRLAFEETGNTIGNILPTPSDFVVQPTFGGYYSFAQMEAAMDALVAAYPSLATKTSLGLSTEGRDIWCIKISDNVATDETDEPEVLYMGVQHAREAITGASMIFLMQYLCEYYSIDSRVKDLVDNREFFIIPCLNPDGWEYNRSTNPNGGGGWRKNKRVNPGSGTSNDGVDLNRNWGVDWGNCSGASSSCGSGSYSSSVYYGPSAFSEPETQAVRDFVYAHHIVACMDQHAYGPYYSLPFGRPSLHTGVDSLTIMDQQFYTRIPAMMGNYNGMRAGNSIQSVQYEVAGGVKDWMLKGDYGMSIGSGVKGKAYGMTGEGGAGGGTGGTYGNFWAPAAQIINLCKGMTFQNLQLAYASGSYVDLQDAGAINLAAKTGSFAFDLRRIGLEDQPVTVSLIPLENIISTGSPVTINSMPNYYDTYAGSIGYTLPGSLGNGKRVRYIWRMETAGYSWEDTVTKFYNPLILFSDNMESGAVGTNWTISGGGWNYSTDDAHGGSRSLTESPGGLYPANANRIATYNSSFDLSDATAAYISFWVKHRAENFQDKMQVQISNNGGGSWTAITGSTTVEEPGTLDGSTLNGAPSLTGVKDDWTREYFSLEDYLGDANVQLRFRFTSNSTSGFFYAEDDGFYIDDLNVVKINNSLNTLPVEFLYFNGKIQSDHTASLQWDAVTDDKHDHFDVERSFDGNSFTNIGTVTGDGPYQFTDPGIRKGNNYYRIRQADKDGNITYSKVINLEYEVAGIRVSVNPNPVKDFARLNISSAQPDTYRVMVTDLYGRIIHQQKQSVTDQPQEVQLDMRSNASQIYVIVVKNSHEETILTQKFMKQ